LGSRSVRIFGRVLPVSSRPAVSAADLLFCGSLPFLFVISWLPERSWHSICYLFEYLKAFHQSEASRHCIETIRRSLSLDGKSTRPEEIKLGTDTTRTEHSIQILREYKPGGWHPSIKIEGLENLERAISERKGVVLWVSHFAFSSLVTKKALAEVGYQVTHVSRPEHGFSKSRFGITWLNPLRCAVEDNYLARRILIRRDIPGAAFRSALDILRAGGIISITVGAWEGRTLAEGPFLTAKIQLAVGAPKLGYESGAQVLPVFTVRDSFSRAFLVIIGEPLLPPEKADIETSITSAVENYLTALAPVVTGYPDQWRGWDKLVFS
jgi:lauroyl/myristoyl acyltransferase